MIDQDKLNAFLSGGKFKTELDDETLCKSLKISQFYKFKRQFDL